MPPTEESTFPPDRIALTVQEAADACGYSKTFITEQIDAGNLAAVAPKGCRSKRVLIDDVKDWLRAKPWEPRVA
ncbi:helix-turn-helix transcriptional regulator [Nocardia terpenica]|uniref:Helix-turn-helix domain-containing protein n=1 Tax=Nocardia terpenica TaxID=455432 RepID=A0A164PMT0_9NOCA|nr:helix-turn-helix domain-containing protein [Nocardia terpenica]KZM75787.1 hypothetical protein AWN90_20845 [Nocardia terpenica]NQE86306.1 helix-turn-helix domain-containing protein [Nocardia terpenica]